MILLTSFLRCALIHCQYFIPGLIPPLTATLGKNGKVSFLEKFGTSEFSNSTGAYELDISLAPHIPAHHDMTRLIDARTLNRSLSQFVALHKLFLPREMKHVWRSLRDSVPHYQLIDVKLAHETNWELEDA